MTITALLEKIKEDICDSAFVDSEEDNDFVYYDSVLVIINEYIKKYQGKTISEPNDPEQDK